MQDPRLPSATPPSRRAPHDLHLPRALPALGALSRLGALSALSALIFLGACAERGRPERLDDPAAREAGLKTLEWMQRRVALMVETKASCDQMASALLTQDGESSAERAAWRAAGAQEWLVARAQVDKDFERTLGDLIAKGDLVYSYCAFFESFRQTLARGEPAAR